MANYVSKHSGTTIDAAVDSINNLAPFSGATVNANGSEGLVPAPVIGDQGKFLRGDGTWQAFLGPTKTSELTNDSNYVADASYVHTDNNYTTAEKEKLKDLEIYHSFNGVDEAYVGFPTQLGGADFFGYNSSEDIIFFGSSFTKGYPGLSVYSDGIRSITDTGDDPMCLATRKFVESQQGFVVTISPDGTASKTVEEILSAVSEADSKGQILRVTAVAWGNGVTPPRFPAVLDLADVNEEQAIFIGNITSGEVEGPVFYELYLKSDGKVEGHSRANTFTRDISLSTSWYNSSAPFTQSVSVSGIFETDTPILDLICSTSNFEAEQEAWNKVFKAVCNTDGVITFYASEPTKTTINLQVKVVR